MRSRRGPQKKEKKNATDKRPGQFLGAGIQEVYSQLNRKQDELELSFQFIMTPTIKSRSEPVTQRGC